MLALHEGPKISEDKTPQCLNSAENVLRERIVGRGWDRVCKGGTVCRAKLSRNIFSSYEASYEKCSGRFPKFSGLVLYYSCFSQGYF